MHCPMENYSVVHTFEICVCTFVRKQETGMQREREKLTDIFLTSLFPIILLYKYYECTIVNDYHYALLFSSFFFFIYVFNYLFLS